jgi:hypothetical protein
VIDNVDHDQVTLLPLAHLRFDSSDCPVGRHSAAARSSADHRPPATHRHMAGTLLLRWRGGQAWQEASQDRRNRPEQDGTNRNGHSNSAHKHPFRLHPLYHDTDRQEHLAVILVTSGSSSSHFGCDRRPTQKKLKA